MVDLLTETPPLPCPECRRAGRGGGARIGNRRSVCAACNSFSQRVLRVTNSRLRQAHPEQYEALRQQVTTELYEAQYGGQAQ